jgi:5-methylcytosine-specific restriction endonuclease McrA
MHIIDLVLGKTPGIKRSVYWRNFKRKYMKKVGECSACPSTKKLELHHIKSFHEYPELELDPENVICLCRSKKWGQNCHLNIGHKGNYRDINPDVRRMAKESKEYLSDRGGKK